MGYTNTRALAGGVEKAGRKRVTALRSIAP